MLRLAAVFAFIAGPALAGGLEIEVLGETVTGTVQIDLLEDVYFAFAEVSARSSRLHAR